MSEALAKRDQEYRPYGGALELFHCTDPEVLIEGPAGTGKTRAVLEYVNLCCELFPGIRVLFCRQTLESLRESVLVTWEQKVLGEGHAAIDGDASRDHRKSYTYPRSVVRGPDGQLRVGRSHIVLAGLDKPEKTFSTEYDICVVFEAIETSLDSWEKLLRVNRNGRMPWQQSIADTNPGHFGHWLNKRAKQDYEVPEGFEDYFPEARPGQKQTTRILSRHIDNPWMYDRETKRWTPEGASYLAHKLHGMSGPRKMRLLEGMWVSEEGLVWDVFDEAIHTVDAQLMRRKDGHLVVREPVQPAAPDAGESFKDHVISWTMCSIDHGFRNPGALAVWGKDTSGYWWLLRLVYRSEQMQDWWADVFAGISKEFKIQAAPADPSAPGMIKALNWRIGRRTEENALVRRADNDFQSGRDCVDALLAVDEQGLPGVRFLRDHLREGRDELIAGQGKPTDATEEIQQYVWKQTKEGLADKEEPKKENDHFCDAFRYFAKYVLTNDHTPKAPEPVFAPGTFGQVLGHKRKKRRR